MKSYTFVISFITLLILHPESDKQITKNNESLVNSHIETIKKKYPLQKINKKTFGLKNNQRANINPRKNSNPGQILGVSTKEPKVKNQTIPTSITDSPPYMKDTNSNTSSTQNWISENSDNDFDNANDLSDEEIEELLNTMFNS